MWHYVLHGVDDDILRHRAACGAVGFVREALRCDGAGPLLVREPYFASVTAVDTGLYDGQQVDLDLVVDLVTAAVTDDDALPFCRFDGAAGQYVNVGLDGEIYLGLNSRQFQAEENARQRGFLVDLTDAASPYSRAGERSLDLVLDDSVWGLLARRVNERPVVALERFGYGPYGGRVHLLDHHTDVSWLFRAIRPRAALAVFPAGDLASVDEARDLLASPAGSGAGPELRVVYRRGGTAGTPNGLDLAAIPCYDMPSLDAVLAGLRDNSAPQVLIAPKFADWDPPRVCTYIRPDADGVVRSLLAFHTDDS